MARKSAHTSYDTLWKSHFRDNHSTKFRSPAYPLHSHDKDYVAYDQALLCNVTAYDYIAFLRACSKHKDLCQGMSLHDSIVKMGFWARCSDALVTMYAKCGALADAKHLLYTHKSRDVFSWTALITGYAQKGHGQDAIDCFDQMQLEGLSPDAVTFACILKACGSVGACHKGEQIHDEIARQGLLQNDIVLGNALVSMYAKCGALLKAQRMLEELPVRNVTSWSALIQGYAQHSQGEQALNCLEQMRGEHLSPNAVTFACILKACGSIGAIDKGEQIHNEIAREGLLGNNVVLGNAMVDMYAKCGALHKAHQVLEQLPVRDVVSWNALISGYAQQDQGEKAVHCFERMQCEGLSPDSVTFSCIVKAYGNIGALDKGEQIHDLIVRLGLLRNNIMLSNALVDMYAKCGALTKAQEVFDELPIRDVVSYNSLIAGYAKHEKGKQALNCFERMQHDGLSPDSVTFTCILKACGSIGAGDKGEQLHYEIVRQGLLENDMVLGTALVDMYAKCGALRKARQLIEELPVRNVTSWSALIAGYAQHGQGQEALNCFERMQHEGLSPDEVTFACILRACGSVGALDKGEEIHDEIDRKGLLQTNIALGNALVDMYAKCGALAKAQQVLEALSIRDVVSWSALIAGYAQQDQGEQALKCFERMQLEGLSPNAVTFACILKACGSTKAVDKGEQVHIEIARQGLLGDNVVLGSALVDMYSKCGALAKAQEVLEHLVGRDVVSWNALIAGYAKHGQGEQALKCLEQMQEEGLSPDEVTFACSLKACGSIGAGDKGKQVQDELGNNIVLGNTLVDMYVKCGAPAKVQQVLDEISVRIVRKHSSVLSKCIEKVSSQT